MLHTAVEEGWIGAQIEGILLQSEEGLVHIRVALVMLTGLALSAVS